LSNNLGKLESFTNLNLAAIKGDDFPYKNHDSQGSVGGLGRDDLFTRNNDCFFPANGHLKIGRMMITLW
jgi:hypothetical protein